MRVRSGGGGGAERAAAATKKRSERRTVVHVLAPDALPEAGGLVVEGGDAGLEIVDLLGMFWWQRR